MAFNLPTSPIKGSGHGGSKSPRKRDRVEMLETYTVKLRSPMKRSMSELNRIAYENALKKKPKLLADSDEVDSNELSVLENIIKLSHSDNTFNLKMEEEEKEDVAYESIVEEKPSLDLEEVKKEDVKFDIPENEPPLSPLKSTIQTMNVVKKEILELSPSTTPVMTPSKSSLKSEIKVDVSSEFSSPSKRQGRRRTNLLAKLEDASIESTPTGTPRRRRRNLHSTFNSMNDIIPENHQQIKLMEVPKIDAENDDLLSKENSSKNQVMYHDGYEAYFEQNHRKFRASKSSMTQAPDITYEKFNKYNKVLDLLCSEPILSLSQLYRFQFSQWLFELNESFNLLFYGVGSKRELLTEFLRDFVLPYDSKAKCIVINGYNTEFTLRVLLREIWRICFRKSMPTARELREACNIIHLEFMKARNKNKKLYILMNNIDGQSMRNTDLQSMLSEIARIEQISIICSIDNLVTPVLWDASVLSNYNFVWHNVSTFKSYTTEVSFLDPLKIGKTDELVGSRGAKYVLNSLTGNAKSLYKNLILQQLEQIDIMLGDDPKMIENRGNMKGSLKCCIALRDFYELCVGEFIISNDISFRTILGEFVEHKMCTLTRDTSGMEVLYIAFSVDELEKLLDEDLLD
ncbi:hypothetical protein CANINC_000320 [Pichia inconspicua]|uniref:Origin recognition complex subunit 2 n=1 Tax=Pichia inconspicua TaxID=52247 RepID=A0A4T0X6D5_9ASCO|nr:hypothetical protein CANINC_000320 [[Candida] inconspicua]